MERTPLLGERSRPRRRIVLLGAAPLAAAALSRATPAPRSALAAALSSTGGGGGGDSARPPPLLLVCASSETSPVLLSLGYLRRPLRGALQLVTRGGDGLWVGRVGHDAVWIGGEDRRGELPLTCEQAALGPLDEQPRALLGSIRGGGSGGRRRR